jgi:hypothetical protein
MYANGMEILRSLGLYSCKFQFSGTKLETTIKLLLDGVREINELQDKTTKETKTPLMSNRNIGVEVKCEFSSVQKGKTWQIFKT